MKKILTLAIIFMGLNSCNKTSENPEDYINFMINNEFQLNYLKDTTEDLEWERGGVQKGVGNFKFGEELKFRFYVKNSKANNYSLYLTSLSGLHNKYIGDISSVDLKRKWELNKEEIGNMEFSGMRYRIDLESETIERKSKTLTEILVKVKS